MTSAEAIEKLLKAYPGGRISIELRGGDPQLIVVLLYDYLDVPLAHVSRRTDQHHVRISIDDALTAMVTMCTKMLQSRYEDCVSRIETLTSG